MQEPHCARLSHFTEEENKVQREGVTTNFRPPRPDCREVWEGKDSLPQGRIS